MTLQLAIILVPVIFGLMGFAVDLGRLYLIRGELNQAASNMAMAAASQLNGTTNATTITAQAVANALIDPTQTDSNSYNFGSLIVGQGNNGTLSAATPSFSFFASRSDAVQGGNTVDGTTARYVAVNLSADAPLLFWGLFSFGAALKTSIAATAIAGLSAPLCTACTIAPFAIAPVDATDLTDFGYVAGTEYTLGYQCTGGATPAALVGTRRPYVIIDRFANSTSTLSEDEQLFEIGAQGLLPSTTSTQSCATVNETDTVWATAAPTTCAAVTASVRDAMCGVSTRFTGTTPTACTNIANVATVAPIYTVDTDVTSYSDLTTYQSTYAGNNRRIITLPIVDTVATSATAVMTIQGFRQFLVEPTTGISPIANNPADANGRLVVMYLGNVAPIRQGRFDGASCGITNGPGKVVLQQ